MKAFLTKLKNQKQLHNWLIITILTVIICCSVILNLIFIPKYFNSQHNETATTTLVIDAVIGDPNNKLADPTVIQETNFGTDFHSLGQLMASFNDQYYQITNSKSFGHFLTGVYQNIGPKHQWITPTTNQSWFIYYWDVKEHQYLSTSAGMDLTVLHNHDHYRLSLQTY